MNKQMVALLVVADQYDLNPFTREIFAFPDKQGGVVPVVGVDGWLRIINSHAQADGFEFTESEDLITPEDGKICPEWMEVTIYRKDRSHPVKAKEYLDEVYRPAFQAQRGKVMGPWQTHTKAMRVIEMQVPETAAIEMPKKKEAEAPKVETPKKTEEPKPENQDFTPEELNESYERGLKEPGSDG